MAEKVDVIMIEYYRAEPESQYELMKDIIALQDSLEKEQHEGYNPNFMYAISYARLGLAAEKIRKAGEAAEYIHLATIHWQKRREWNYEYQTMLPVTPSPRYEDARSEIENLVIELDRELAKSTNEN